MFIYGKFYDKFQQVVQVVYILAAAHSDLAIGRSRGHVDLLSNTSGNGNRNVTVMSFHARLCHRILACQLTPCQAMAPHFDLHTHTLNISVA